MIAFLKKPIGIFLIILTAVGGIGVFLLANRPQTPKYDSVIVNRQNLLQEVNVTGRVHPAETVDLSFEKTGTVHRLLADVGQSVQKDELLAQLDTQDAQKEVRDTQIALESAQVQLGKIRLEQQQLLRGDTLNKNYEDGLAILANLYNELETMLDDINDIYFGSELSSGNQTNFQYYANALNDTTVVFKLTQLYNQSKALYTNSVMEYQLAERGSGEARLHAIQSGYDLTVKIAETIKTGRDSIREFQNTILSGTAVHTQQTTINEHANDLTAHATIIDTYAEDLLSILNTINDQLDSLDNYPLDISAQELIVRQKENDLLDAKNNLAKYSIVAPIDAVVTKKDINVGEIVSANALVFTIISEAQFEVEANMPEADITKIHMQNPAEITLDAYGRDTVFEALVTKMDPAEIIIDGVPTYKVTLQFTAADSRIRSGMTANITIITAEKENVLAIPQRAIIREDGNKFVQIVQGTSIQKVQVETGLQASNGNIEIINGIQEGERVITFFPE